MNESVLGRQCPTDAFPNALARFLRDKADVAARAIGSPQDSPWTPRHVESLRSLAEYVSTLNQSDQRLHALWLLQSHLGGDSDEFTPGPERQTDFLARIGFGPNAPEANEALNEFVAAGIEDIATRRHLDLARAEGFEAKAASLEVFRDQVTTAQAEADLLRDELNAARADLERANEERDYLRTLVPSGSGEPAASVLEPAGSPESSTAKAKAKAKAPANA